MVFPFLFDESAVFSFQTASLVAAAILIPFFRSAAQYSELNLNQYSVASPCRTICTVCSSSPCPDLNLIHYI